MKEMAPILFLLLIMTTVCWFLVFSRVARHKVQKSAWKLYKLNQEKREMYDAMYFAGVLVLALALTIFSAFALIRAIMV